MTSIFVAKLDFGVDNQQLTALFETYGKVNKATVALDRETGKSRGFGFVEMLDAGEAETAIKNLDNSLVNGRPIAVKQAEDRSNARPAPRPSGDAPRRDFRPGEGTTSREFSRPNVDDSPAPFVPEIKKEIRNKVPKAPTARENEGPKVKKMEAYKKSGKDNRFLGDDDDDLEGDFDLFGRDEDEEEDEDYSKYLANASDDDDEDEDYDDDEEYDDEEEDED